MFLEHFKGWWLHHLPPWAAHSIVWPLFGEVFPNIQPKRYGWGSNQHNLHRAPVNASWTAAFNGSELSPCHCDFRLTHLKVDFICRHNQWDAHEMKSGGRNCALCSRSSSKFTITWRLNSKLLFTVGFSLREKRDALRLCLPLVVSGMTCDSCNFQTR